jgi:hypothetical protein
MSDKKISSSRLAKIEKWEFAACTERSRSIANDHFYSKHNEEIGFFLLTLVNHIKTSVRN